MKPFFILFTYIIFFTTLLFSQEIFLDKAWEESKGIYSKTKSYCHLTKEENQFCEKSTLSYPVFQQTPNKKITDAIETIIQKITRGFEKENLQKTVLQNISENVYQPGGEWKTKNAWDLFAVTDTTFTLVDENSGYTGGAHGYYSVIYENYSHDGTSLNLDSLLKDDYNATLYKIAERFYKKSVGLAPNESLVRDGWFNNKFVLTSNFAITNEGLLFHYNSYEIKAYASGHTAFLLPYTAIRTLIKPDGLLHPYLKKSHKSKRTFLNDDIARLSLSIERISDTEVKIIIKERRFVYAKQNWLSLSFPQLRSKTDVNILSSKGFSATLSYSAGAKVYHRTQKKAVRSKYLLVEGASLKEEDNDSKEIILTATVPPRAKMFIIHFRVSFKNGKTLTTFPQEWDGVRGQQDFSNFQLAFPLE